MRSSTKIAALVGLCGLVFGLKTAYGATIYSSPKDQTHLWNTAMAVSYTSNTSSLVCGFGFQLNKNGSALPGVGVRGDFYLGEAPNKGDPNGALYFGSSETSTADGTIPTSSVSLSFVQFLFKNGCSEYSPGDTFWFALVVNTSTAGISLNAGVHPNATGSDAQIFYKADSVAGSPGYLYPVHWVAQNGSPLYTTGLEVYGTNLGAGTAILFPPNLSSIDDFGAWSVYANLTQSSTLFVDYGTLNTSTYQFTDQGALTSPSSSVYNIPKTHQLVSLFQNTSTPWYARVRAVVGTTTISTSDPITFFVRSANTPTGGATTTDACAFFSGDVTGISSAFCMVTLFAFKPPDFIFNGFIASFDQYKNRPPLGYVTAALAALGGVATSSPAFNLGDLSAFSGFFSPIDLGLASVLAFAFLMWIVVRLKNIQI